MKNILTPEKIAEHKQEIPDGAIEVARDLIIGKYPNEEAFLDDYNKDPETVLEEMKKSVAPNLEDEIKIKELKKRIDEKIKERFPELGLQEAA